MTAEDIDAMEAGRELDALVAERVFGIDLSPVTHDEHEWYMPDAERDISLTCKFCGCDNSRPEIMCIEIKHTRSYSTDIAAAWLVVEKFRNTFGEFVFDIDGDWRCFFGGKLSIADTAPLALCRAALKAVSEKVVA